MGIPSEWLGIIQSVQGGVFLLALWLGSNGVWVYGWVYKAKCEECEFYKKLALRGTDVAEIATSTIEKVTRIR